MRGEKRGIFLFPFFGRIGEDELAACWFFIGYSSLLAWPPTRLSASMDLAPLFLAFRFSGGREREGSAPSARIVCQPKWLSLYQSPGIVCHCWRRQRKPWLLGFFRKFADACEVRKQPLPTHAMNKSRLRFCLCVYVCVSRAWSIELSNSLANRMVADSKWNKATRNLSIEKRN